MRGEQDCLALFMPSPKKFPYIPPGVWVNSHGRLIEKEILRIVDHCLCNHQFALHTAGQVLGRPRPDRLQPKICQQAVGGSGDIGLSHPVKPSCKLHVFFHREFFVEIYVLAGHTHRLFNRDGVPVHRTSVKFHGSAVRNQKAGHHTHQRRFSGAVRPQQSQKCSIRHLHGDVFNRLYIFKSFRQAAALDHGVIFTCLLIITVDKYGISYCSSSVISVTRRSSPVPDFVTSTKCSSR